MSRVMRVLDEPKPIKPATLKPRDWIAIVERTVDTIKQYLNEFPTVPAMRGGDGFHTIKDRVNCHLREYDDRVTEQGVMELAEGLSPESELLYLSTVNYHYGPETVPGYGASTGEEHQLFLTRDGRLVLWNFKYQRVVRSGLGYRQHRSGVREQAEVCRFGWVDQGTLSQLIEAKPALWSDILQVLEDGLRNLIRQQERSLAEKRESAQYLSAIRSRIDR